jgi:N-acetylneuraminic acid mutarotase
MKKQSVMKGNDMRKFLLSAAIFLVSINLVSMNHNAAGNLCKENGEGPLYRIEWVSKASLPLPHRNGKAVACGGKIYFMGGYCPETEEVRETSNYRYDPQKNEWTVKADVPIGRSNFAITSFESGIFVIGGDPVLPNNDLYSTSKDKWEVLAPLSLPRQHIDCARIGSKIYVVGGLVRDLNPPEDSEQKIPKIATDTIEIYNIEDNKWEMGKPLRDARQGVQVAATGGKLYVIGGVCSRDRNFMLSSAFERYDPDSDIWESLPNLPVPILAPGIAVIEGKILVIGGSTIINGSQTASDKVYVFDTSKNSWGTATSLPKGMQFPGVAFIDDRIYVIGGCDKEFKAYDSVYEGRVISLSF